MVAPALVALVLLGAPPAHPRVDVSAMKEAMEAPTDDYSSASACAHFLRARLLALQGEHAPERGAAASRAGLGSRPAPSWCSRSPRHRPGPAPRLVPRSPRADSWTAGRTTCPRCSSSGGSSTRPNDRSAPGGPGAGPQARSARAGAVSAAGGDVARVGAPRRCRANGAGAGRPESRHHRSAAAGHGAARPGRARDCPCAAGEDRADRSRRCRGPGRPRRGAGGPRPPRRRPRPPMAGRWSATPMPARCCCAPDGLALRPARRRGPAHTSSRLASLDIGPEHVAPHRADLALGREARSRHPGAGAGACRE